MWKKILLFVVVLVIGAVVGMTIYVDNIDWNRHKDKISREFSAATGKEVVFNGAVRFNVFPSPYLEADNIDIFNGYTEQGEKVKLANIKKLVVELSVQSLLKGNFNIERMNIVEPEAYIEVYENGRLNWQSAEGGQAQELRLDGVEVSLDSVTIQQAKLHLLNRKYEVDTLLNHINAEVIAQSLYGPYRIEGSYVKDEVPGGFAVSLGSFSDSFATSVNAVINHPRSESYVRFDGTVLLQNDAVNGNLIIESRNPVHFANSSFKDLHINEKYEYPLALSMEIKTDKTQVNLANIVVKYGQSAGAGNIQIPRILQQIGEEGEQRRRIDAVFNMTELEFNPLLQLTEDLIAKIKADKKYIPEFDFDLIADFKAVKAIYRNQAMRDLDISVDFVDNVARIRNFSIGMPGDTSFKAAGEIFSKEKQLTYNFDVSAGSNDFSKLVGWLGWQPQIRTPGTYKKANLNANVSGTLDMVKLAPVEFMLDKTNVSGKIGVVRGSIWRWLAIADIDNLNFDNYLPPLPEDLKNATFEEKTNYRFEKLSGLNNLDLQMRSSLKVGILEKVPFENLQADFVVKNGVMKINNLSVSEMAGANFAVQGELNGFGKTPSVKNAKYQIDVRETDRFVEKFGLEIPAVDFRVLTGFNSSGVITGSWDRFAAKTTSRLGNIDIVYNGEVSRHEGAYTFNGKTEIKAPDFVRFLNQMSVDYAPDYPLGLFRFSADVAGNFSGLVAKNINANIGTNQFSGEIVYLQREGRNRLKADLTANRFEIEKFFYNKAGADKNNFRSGSNNATFLAKPSLNLAKIDYGWLDSWDLDGRFSVDALSFNNVVLNQTSWVMGVRNNVVKVAKFVGQKGDGTVTFEGELNIPQEALLTAKAEAKNLEISRDVLNGTVYGITSGLFSGSADITTSALSEDSLLSQLSGTLKFDINKFKFKGWDFIVIETDLEKRDISEGFGAVVREALNQGETSFNDFGGRLVFAKGMYALDNASMNNDSLSLTINSDGNLKDWTGSTLFRVTFNNDSAVPGFDFSFDGSLASPTMDADITRVTKVYDAHWEKVASKAKAEAEAKIKKYRGLMDEQQDKTQEIADNLMQNIWPRFEQQSGLAEDKRIRQEYTALEEKINSVKSSLEEIAAKDDLKIIDDEVINEIKGQNAQLEKKVAEIDSVLRDLHARDVRLRINDKYNRLFELNKQAKQTVAEYQDIYGGFDKRLAAINSDFALRSNETVDELQNEMEQAFLFIDTAYSDVAKDHVVVANITDVNELEKYFQRFEKSEREAQEKMTGINNAIAAFRDYAETNISEAEQAYAEKLKSEEIRRKLEENTGQISTAGGKTLTIGRDLVEIEKSEDALRNEKVRVLDFSKDRVSGEVTVPSRSRKSKEETLEDSLLRESSGQYKPSSGIVVKQ